MAIYYAISDPHGCTDVLKQALSIVDLSDPDYHEVYWDGESHYFLDGSTEWSDQMPVLTFDTETQVYHTYLATKDGVQDTDAPVAP